jgi:hypothetical protein
MRGNQVPASNPPTPARRDSMGTYSFWSQLFPSMVNTPPTSPMPTSGERHDPSIDIGDVSPTSDNGSPSTPFEWPPEDVHAISNVPSNSSRSTSHHRRTNSAVSPFISHLFQPYASGPLDNNIGRSMSPPGYLLPDHALYPRSRRSTAEYMRTDDENVAPQSNVPSFHLMRQPSIPLDFHDVPPRSTSPSLHLMRQSSIALDFHEDVPSHSTNSSVHLMRQSSIALDFHEDVPPRSTSPAAHLMCRSSAKKPTDKTTFQNR